MQDSDPLRDLTAYEVSFLPAHLEAAGRALDLHRLLRLTQSDGANAWYATKRDISKYLEDVARAWRLADEETEIARERDGEAVRLGRQVRYALITASVRSLVEQIPGTLWRALTEGRVWSTAQALAYAQAIPSAQLRTEALSRLWPHVSESLLDEALQATAAIEDSRWRSEALQALAPYLRAPLLERALDLIRTGPEWAKSGAFHSLLPKMLEPQRRHILIEALRALQALANDEVRSDVLLKLAPYLTEVMREALDAAQVLWDDWARSRALVGLARYASASLRIEILKAVRAIERQPYRSQALAEMVSYLPEPLRLSVAAEALANARAVPNAATRSETLCALLPFVAGLQHDNVLCEALDAARLIAEDQGRCEALAELAPYLEELGLEEALDAAGVVDDDYCKSEALARLAPHLNRRLLQHALAVAEGIEDGRQKSGAVAALVPYVAAQGSPEACLQWVRLIHDEFFQFRLLADLAPRLPPMMFGDVLKLISEMRDERAQSRALASVAEYLPEPLLERALSAALAVSNEAARSYVLAMIAPCLSEGREGVLKEALWTAKTIREEQERKAAIATVVERSLTLERPEDVLEVVRIIGDDCEYVQCVAAFAPYLPGPQQQSLLSQALEVASTINHKETQSCALGAVARALPNPTRQSVVKLALNAAHAITNEHKRTAAVARLAPDMSEALLQNAFEVVGEVGDEESRADALLQLAQHVPPRWLDQFEQMVLALGNEPRRSDVLAEFMLRLAELHHSEKAFALMRELKHEPSRCRALVALASHLSEPLQEAAVDAVRSIRDGRLRCEALAVLASHAAEPARSRALDEVVESVARLGDPIARANLLARLLASISEPERQKFFGVAVAAARAVEDNRVRSYVLAELGSPLSGTVRSCILEEALQAARAIEWGPYDRINALAAIAVQLTEDQRLAVVTEALRLAAEIRDEDVRGGAVAGLAQAVSMPVVEQTLKLVCPMRNPQWRHESFMHLAPHIVVMPPDQRYALWTHTLHVLASRMRPNFLEDLGALSAAIAPGGEQEVLPVVAAIEDVRRWWP